jgi:hypothetical protein
VVFEAVEVRCPEPAVGRQPVVELRERLRPNPIEAPLGIRPRFDQPRVLEDAEMLGNGGLAEADVVDELADRSFPVAEQIQDRDPARFGQDLERSELGHDVSMTI